MKPYKSFRESNKQYKIGDIVYHNKLGKCRVDEIDNNDKLLVTILDKHNLAINQIYRHISEFK